MASDVVDLRDFYRSALGQVARRMIRRAAQRVWPDMRGMRLLGIGYPTPFLSALAGGGRQSRDPRRRGRAALRRLFDRQGAAGPRARNQRRGPRDAEGDLA